MKIDKKPLFDIPSNYKNTKPIDPYMYHEKEPKTAPKTHPINPDEQLEIKGESKGPYKEPKKINIPFFRNDKDTK